MIRYVLELPDKKYLHVPLGIGVSIEHATKYSDKESAKKAKDQYAKFKVVAKSLKTQYEIGDIDVGT